MTALNSNYIYLLQEREFTKTKESIYKIGKTTQPNITRFSQYPRGSILLLQLICIDCNITEKNIITAFKQKYIHRKDIGYEYFEGDYIDMIQSIFNIVTLTNNIFTCSLVEPVNIPIVEPVVNNIVSKESTVKTVQTVKFEINNIESDQTTIESELIVKRYKNNYYCEVCKYYTCIKRCYNDHLQSDRHKHKLESPNDCFETNCIKCNKILLSRTSLWRHNKICKVIPLS